MAISTVRSNCVINEYNSLEPSHEFSTLRIKSNTYDYTTLVNTHLVHELSKFVWFRHSSEAYTASSINTETRKLVDRFPIFNELGTTLLLHRYIAALAQIPNTCGGTYIDHIDRLTLDNRIANLRWATQALQNQNTDKRARKKGAQELPSDIGLTEGQKLPKYVVWYCDHEKSSSSTDDKQVILERKYFKIEKHPALTKPWISTKNSKISNLEKFKLTLAKLSELDKIVNPDPDADLRAALVKEYNAIMGG